MANPHDQDTKDFVFDTVSYAVRADTDAPIPATSKFYATWRAWMARKSFITCLSTSIL